MKIANCFSNLLCRYQYHLSGIFFILSLFEATPVVAATYICQSDGRAVFSTSKINSSCKLSQMDGISERSASEPESNDSITQLWEKQQFGMYDDVKIVAPSAAVVTNTADAANPKLRIKLRNNKSASTTAKRNSKPVKPAPVIAAPPPKPQLTRKQILQNEIRNEEVALLRAKAELNVAKKKGDTAKINRLRQTVSDREANIRAIRNEMSR